MKMQSFNRRAAQGEIQIIRHEEGYKLPPHMKPLEKENNKLIIGHSETGHHHVLERPAEVFVPDTAPAGMRILYAILEEPNALIHERGYDTHKALNLEPGIYEFRIGREFDHYEALARRQAD